MILFFFIIICLFFIVIFFPDTENGHLFPGVQILKEKIDKKKEIKSWVRFHNVRIPRNNLLNKFGGINQSGNYETKVNFSPEERFIKMKKFLFVSSIFSIFGVRSLSFKLFKMFTNKKSKKN